MSSFRRASGASEGRNARKPLLPLLLPLPVLTCALLTSASAFSLSSFLFSSCSACLRRYFTVRESTASAAVRDRLNQRRLGILQDSRPPA